MGLPDYLHFVNLSFFSFWMIDDEAFSYYLIEQAQVPLEYLHVAFWVDSLLLDAESILPESQADHFLELDTNYAKPFNVPIAFEFFVARIKVVSLHCCFKLDVYPSSGLNSEQNYLVLNYAFSLYLDRNPLRTMVFISAQWEHQILQFVSLRTCLLHYYFYHVQFFTTVNHFFEHPG